MDVGESGGFVGVRAVELLGVAVLAVGFDGATGEDEGCVRGGLSGRGEVLEVIGGVGLLVGLERDAMDEPGDTALDGEALDGSE